MKPFLSLSCAATLALCMACPSFAQAPAAAPAASAATPAQVEIDPNAMAALNRMGTTLRGLPSFGLHIDTTSEEVLTTGQKIQHGGNGDYLLRRPNAFRIETNSDRTSRIIVYDGTTLTLFSPRIGYWAAFPAPPTIRETLIAARDRLALELPISDLFTWGTDPVVSGAVTSAISVGPETINGQECDQYALRQADVDWQIWLRQGAQPLPCKIVITSTDDPSMPQFSALFTWRLDATFAADSFTFTPPDGARRIQFSQPQQER
ncbi:MAG TPA: DUF2092 domain-containing protein [Allosphingosinicella sp.]